MKKMKISDILYASNKNVISYCLYIFTIYRVTIRYETCTPGNDIKMFLDLFYEDRPDAILGFVCSVGRFYL